MLGPDVDRLATLHTNAKTDAELLKVWLKSHRDGSAHTVRVYARVGERFLAALAPTGRAAQGDRRGCAGGLEAMRSRRMARRSRPATVNTYVGP